ncbi:MAG: FMN-binding protein [Planctomycetota bacterium]|jgi:RnfABCDGE-type electron transport complex G subunit
MPEQPPQVEKTELTLGSKIVRYGGILFMIAAVCVLLINLVYSMTKDRILEEQKKKIMKGVCAIFNMPLEQASTVTEHKKVAIGGNQKTDFFSHDGKLACTVKPIGYDGPITMIVGYMPADDTVLGIYVVSHTETPGFGARFMEKKQGKSIIGYVIGEEVAPPTALDNQTGFLKFQQPFYNKPAKVFEPADIGECADIDGITGATISSQAVYTGVRTAIALLKRFDPEKGGLRPAK